MICLLLACSSTPTAVTTPAITATPPSPLSPHIPNPNCDLSLNYITNNFGAVEASTNDVMLFVDEVYACRCDPCGAPIAENHGYVYVIVSARVISHNNTVTVNPADIVLLDSFENIYKKYDGETCFELEPLAPITPQTGRHGALIYPVPLASAQGQLWVQWSQGMNKLKVKVIQPVSGAEWSE
jgi:hypothetical protein